MKSLFEMMAAHNAWANGRLYDAADALDEASYRADLGAAFGSIHRTLNHVVVGDRIWLARFTGTGGAPAALDAIVADDLATLHRERIATDAAITTHVAGLDEAALAGRFSYVRKGTRMTQQLAPALMHMFNHQTHHRGQVHALLTRQTGDAPALDLVYFQRESGVGL